MNKSIQIFQIKAQMKRLNQKLNKKELVSKAAFLNMMSLSLGLNALSWTILKRSWKTTWSGQKKIYRVILNTSKEWKTFRLQNFFGLVAQIQEYLPTKLLDSNPENSSFTETSPIRLHYQTLMSLLSFNIQSRFLK